MQKSKAELLNIDCMEYMRILQDNAFDLAIVDPPYREKNQPTKQMREKIKGGMKNFGAKPTQIYFNELFRISKNQVVWGFNNFVEHLYSSNCFLFWYKKNPLPNYSDGELAWTSFQSVAKCIPLIFYGAHTHDEVRIHPTQKPIKLYSWILQNYAKPGQRIFDSHLGSGSSAIAAHYFGAEFVGCEIDSDYFVNAKARIHKETRQISLF